MPEHYQSCALCGHEGPDVRIRLVRWKDPLPVHREYEAWPVCVRRAECRSRVELLGEPWPLAEREERTVGA